MTIYALIVYVEEECKPNGIEPTWEGFKEFKKNKWRDWNGESAI